MEIQNTQRGFAIVNFTDKYGIECSLQKSSLATENAVWFGVDNPKPQIMTNDAIRLGIPTEQNSGWIDFEIPNEVFLSTRMHLTQDMVKQLLPMLQKFAETGELK